MCTYGSTSTGRFQAVSIDWVQATMDFTPSQKKDLLQLRRLLYGRTGQLLRERQALLNRMSDAEQKAQVIMSQPVRLGYCRAR